MRPQKVDDNKLLVGLKAILSSKGYDGASLNELAAASGLQKASLYHRFPGGKKEIALAVLNNVDEWVGQHIINVLMNLGKSPIERLNQAIEKIDELYNGGKSTCVLRAFSMGNGMDFFGAELKDTAKSWIEAFSQLGRDFGLSQDVSRKIALDALMKIQGSLVLSKILEDEQLFSGALKDIRNMYLAA